MSKLISQGQKSFDQVEDLNAAKQVIDPILIQMAALSERLEQTEAREKQLQERLNDSHRQLESVFSSSQEQHRRLDDQAQRVQRDPLTKMYNRTTFHETLELEYRRWVRAQHHLRLVMFDIDGFQAINDSYGYAAGDKALKIIARTMKKCTAKDDMLARFSGEEFVLLIPEQTEAYALDLIKRIQKEVYELPFTFRDHNISMTLSAASTAFKNSDNPERVMDRLLKMLCQGQSRGTKQIEWD